MNKTLLSTIYRVYYTQEEFGIYSSEDYFTLSGMGC